MRPLIIDSFAGGGGASTGIERAIGRPIDIAINHDPEAIAMHLANHMATKHFCQSIMAIDPYEATGGAPVALAWFSPDCKHHSKAKGGKPREKNIRDLAWVVPHWPERLLAATRGTGAPAVMMLENVEEFRQWGPLDAEGMPIKERRGEEFDLWIRRLRRLGYKVEHRELRACDYGAPTSRKRLYLIARRDGRAIVWPTPTHGKPGSPEVLSGARLPWRTAAECIDWSIPCPSIFDRKRELKEATHRRIAHGVMRYVVNAASPFIVGTAFTNTRASRTFDPQDPLRTSTSQPEYGVIDAGIMPLTHHGAARFYSSREPFVTITGAHRGELATVNVTLAPFGTKFRNGAIGFHLADPVPTVTANGNPARPAGAQPLAFAQATLAPLFVRTAHGEQDKSGKKRGRGSHAATETYPTVTASQDSALLGVVLAPVIVGCGGRRGQSGPVNMRGPYPTTTAKADACLAAATMVQMGYGERQGQSPRSLDITAPLGTIVAGGLKHGVVVAHLEKFSENSRGKAATDPLDSVMAGAPRHAAVTTFLSHFYSSAADGGQGDPRKPAKTVTSTGQHHAVVAAHMEQANTGVVGHDMRESVSTIVGKGCTQRLVETTLIDAGALPPDLMARAVMVAAFLIKYYGNEVGGHALSEPIGTVTTKERFAVVTVTIDAVTYVIVDIGMRMLAPRELANAQGFPATYILDPIGPNGKPLSKSAQIRMIGNSVCPDMAEALVRANLPELCTGEIAEAAAA